MGNPTQDYISDIKVASRSDHHEMIYDPTKNCTCWQCVPGPWLNIIDSYYTFTWTSHVYMPCETRVSHPGHRSVSTVLHDPYPGFNGAPMRSHDQIMCEPAKRMFPSGWGQRTYELILTTVLPRVIEANQCRLQYYVSLKPVLIWNLIEGCGTNINVSWRNLPVWTVFLLHFVLFLGTIYWHEREKSHQPDEYL